MRTPDAALWRTLPPEDARSALVGARDSRRDSHDQRLAHYPGAQSCAARASGPSVAGDDPSRSSGLGWLRWRVVGDPFDAEIDERANLEGQMFAAHVGDVDCCLPHGVLRKDGSQRVLECWLLKVDRWQRGNPNSGGDGIGDTGHRAVAQDNGNRDLHDAGGAREVQGVEVTDGHKFVSRNV